MSRSWLFAACAAGALAGCGGQTRIDETHVGDSPGAGGAATGFGGGPAASAGAGGASDAVGGSAGATVSYPPIVDPPGVHACKGGPNGVFVKVVDLPFADGGNVNVGPGVTSGGKAFFSWGSRSCCGGGPFKQRQGLASVTPSLDVVIGSYFPSEDVPPPADGTPPPYAEVPGGFVVLEPVPASKSALVVDPDTLMPTKQVTAPAEPGAWRSVYTLAPRTGGGVTLMRTQALAITRLDASLSIEDAFELQSPVEGSGILVPVPNGSLAFWGETSLVSRRLDAAGAIAGPVVPVASITSPLPYSSSFPVWDGANVVWSIAPYGKPGAIIEISATGALVATTPVASGFPVVAVGLDDSIVVIVDDFPPKTAHILRLERGTGTVLDDLADLADYGGDELGPASVQTFPDAIVFAYSTLGIRDQLAFARVGCAK